MAKDKIKVRLPKPDPRFQNGTYADIYPGTKQQAMDVRDHPAHNKPTATEHYDAHQLGLDAFKAKTDAYGPEVSYRAETGDMSNAVDISESVPRRGLND